MTIRLNGEAHELSAPVSLSALLDGLGIDARRVAVEHNLVVVRRAAYDSTIVRDGDEVEVVNFVGGGSGGPSSLAKGGQEMANRRSRDQEITRVFDYRLIS